MSFIQRIRDYIQTTPGYVNQTKDRQSANMMQGAKSGTINRNEFVSLGNYANETERLRGLYGQSGLNRTEQAELAQRQRQYDGMFSQYSNGEYNPRTYAKDSVQARQLGQLNRTYNGAVDGSLTVNEGRQSLNQGKNISNLKGQYQRQGRSWNNRLNGGERRILNSQLNNSNNQINNKRQNWDYDGGAYRSRGYRGYGW